MQTLFLHGGRAVTANDIVFIRQLIAEHPEASRRALSKQLCEAWNWQQLLVCGWSCVFRLLATRRSRTPTIVQSLLQRYDHREGDQNIWNQQ